MDQKKRFNIEGMGYEEAKAAIAANLEDLQKEFSADGMKPGRYIGVYYMMIAAERGDITSQIALGNLYEFGSIVDRDVEEAKKWYRTALSKDHPKKDGTMLAAGASAGLARLKAE